MPHKDRFAQVLNTRLAPCPQVADDPDAERCDQDGGKTIPGECVAKMIVGK
jgi:hypothetical protein